MIRFSAAALALVGVFAFGFIIYSAYQDAPSPSDVPLISADAGAMRERPAEEGGMTVANRDSTVYQEGTPNGLEQLMPPPEQPIIDQQAAVDPQAPGAQPEPRRPDGNPALTADEIRAMRQSGDAAGQAIEQLATTATNQPPGVSQGQTSIYSAAERLDPPAPAAETATAPTLGQNEPEQQPAQETEQTASVQTSQPETVKPSQTEERQAAAIRPAAGASARMVQLGAVRSEEAAKAEWHRLQAKYQTQLGELDVSIQRADLGSRGVFWRVRGGPISAEDGKKICEALKASGQSCMVVGR
jgi:hypothetical protein